MRRRLDNGFQLFMQTPVEELGREDLEDYERKYTIGEGYLVPIMPMQVHDILIHHGVIEDPSVTGSGEGCTWVSDQDWVYVCRVDMEEAELEAYQNCRLYLGGIDTFARIYWNGEMAACGEDVFLPLEALLGGKCRRENTLVIHVRSPHEKLKQMQMPERYQQKEMPKWALFRGFFRGYDDYLGYKPYLTRMGVYDEIRLEYGDQGIRDLSLQVNLQTDNESGSVGDTSGQIEMEISFFRAAKDSEQSVLICELAEEGKLIEKWEINQKEETLIQQFVVKNPRLWNVIHKGEPFLYEFRAVLMCGGREVDRIRKKIGFRKIEKVGDFDFRINGKPLKLWGANVAPLDNKTGCYQSKRAEKIVEMAVRANMNCLRIWGGGDRLPDSFYEMCDEVGLLLWQDFFHDYSMYPEEEDFRKLCRDEAAFQVRRLQYHPSVLLWCGSNESVMCRDFSNPGQECIGYGIYDEDYRRICSELDGGRYYHMSSPCGGAYANDPLEGDTHSYTSTWFVPGGRYPVFLSENMRAYPPVYHSMLRMVGEEAIWPEGESGQMCQGTVFPWPKAWEPYTSAESWKKISHVEQFYDAKDARTMIYRFGGSVGRYIEECVGRYRRGRSYEEREEDYRKCKGHLWWKMNTSAPHIYSGLLDYYMETYIPYYAMRRSYQPFQLFFSVDDYIGVWAVNDTMEVIRGTVFVKLFHMKQNTAVQFFQVPFSVKPDRSLFVTDLNRFGQFLMNEHVLYAKAVDEKGNVLTERIDYADVERHMEFPDCKLTLSWDGDELVVETDRFARSVELLGEEDGDYFGWQFEDNYFDLLPGTAKRVRVSGNHEKGCIHAKGYYASEETIILYEKA